MHISSNLVVLASSCVALATASPLQKQVEVQSLEGRQTAKCTDIHADISRGCWDELDIASYLNDPKTGWKVTTPTCGSSDDASKCCLPNEPWSTCFIRLATERPGIDCSKIDVQGKCLLGSGNLISPNLSPSIAAKAGYVLRSILSIGNTFNNYYSALNSLQQDSGYDDLTSILNESPAFNREDLVKVMTASLPFWGTPPVLAGGKQGTNATLDPQRIQAFFQGIQQSKGVSSALFGAPSTAELSQVSGSDDHRYLTNSGSDTSFPLNAALGLIMSDIPTFLEFAAHGIYLINPSLNQGAAYDRGLLSALNTYTTSQNLYKNTLFATPMSTTNRDMFQLGRKCTSLGDVCEDSKSVVYYWSNVTNMQYQISFSGKWREGTGGAIQQPGGEGILKDAEGEATTFALLEYIETKSVAYMPVLFDGGYNCTLEGKAGGSPININADGTLDIACLSTVPIYLTKGSPCPQGAVFVDGKCPFGYNG